VKIFGSDRLRRSVVVGFGATAIGRHPGRTADELGLQALDEALGCAGLAAGGIDGIYRDPQGYTRAQPPIRPQRIAERLGISTRALVEVECGGTSALLSFKAA
jgi:acetyl-CoA acetyltransferase